MLKINLQSNWQFHEVDSEKWMRARVPGTVYTDLLEQGEMEDPFFRDNEDQALELMRRDYEYRCSFDCEKEWEELSGCDQILLHFDGLDTLADITLNGHMLGSACNMHRIWEYDIKDDLKQCDNQLQIYLHSPVQYIEEAYKKAPTRGSEDAMPGFVHLRKAHCMFGWDWGAHLPDAGIFRPVSLLGIQKARLEDVEIRQHHEVDACGDTVCVTLEVLVKGAENLEYDVVLTSPEGTKKRYSHSPKKVTVDQPRLWWPNGYGEQPLYNVQVILCEKEKVLDVWERRIGLRRVTMRREKDQWGESFAQEINGVAMFAMGADYIPEDHLLGRVSEATTRKLLEKAIFANFNTVRVWGGGYYPEDWFYDLCDELGLLVWQDFMFACGAYDLTPEFEENIVHEFIDNIRRLRHHASLALMCGNNEMEMFMKQGNWVSKPSEIRDYLFMYERILPALMKQYAPQVFYWPASPSSGGSFDEPNDENRGDVHYWDVWHGNKPFTEYRKFFFRYLSEFGFQSFPMEKTVEGITDREEERNVFSYIMERHQRNGSANGKIMLYMQQMFRYPSDFSAVLYASQLLQAEGIKYGTEHFRRNRGRCMGAIYWQLNDCWPVASWSSIDYGGRLKALHYYARRFFAPLMISCEEQGMLSSGLQLNQLPFTYEKSIRLNVANETMEEKAVTVRWQLRDTKARILRQEEEKLSVPALESVWLDKVLLSEIQVFEEYVSYELLENGTVVSEGTLNLSYPKYFRYEDPKLSARVEGNQIIVSASAYAKSVEILNEEEDLILSDNYFDLNAGEKAVDIISGEPVNLRLRSVYDIR
ncbi:MAG: glycoside hydrolase family 2 protein [Lachnospiraceae bacterium]|nr:glycoside hydrolase family 2 protein [Lachnospiraceae bacterium]